MADVTAAPEVWSIRRVLEWASQDFRERGLPSPRLEAELLLAHVLGVDRIRLILDAERPLAAAELGRMRALIQRRRAREPVAYLLGRREFWGLDFEVDGRVLVPRPDTEALVEEALERTRDRSLHGRLLDLCTGSGCVAIAFAHERPTWAITGADASADALEVARRNALRLGAVWGVRWLRGDLWEALGAGERFELVTANPPYVPSAEVDQLEPDVRAWEPRLALDGGSDGLVLVRRIAAGARERLTPGGTLALELHHDQAERAEGLLRGAGFVEVRRRRDFAGHERVVSGRRA
ncbi:MAG: peptide chain release factor N(5)-glutamine methyltransferase [Polyangiaceae bacterium]|nr:peptide chain release factor N(5)-glutamine methyltransferase [Polyangiaceae bacterium]